MEIVPFVGEEPLTSSSVEIRINPDDRLRAKALVERTNLIMNVSDDLTFSAARQAAGELKAMLDEIDSARKASKQPFAAVERAIDNLAKDVAGPLKGAQNRLLGLLGGYVAKLEAARKAEQLREAEARRRAQAEADRKVREAQEARDQAQAALRAAKSEIEEAKRREEAQRRENQLLQQQLAAELAMDVESLGKDAEPAPGLVPGGRVDHRYEFQLESIQQVCAAGLWRLVRWELDLRACQDAVKNQLDNGVEEPSLAGIRITKKLNVSVKASSRIK